MEKPGRSWGQRHHIPLLFITGEALTWGIPGEPAPVRWDRMGWGRAGLLVSVGCSLIHHRLGVVHLCASAWLQLPPAQPSCIQAAKQIPGDPLASAGLPTPERSSWGPQPWQGAELGCPWLSGGVDAEVPSVVPFGLVPQTWEREYSQGSGQRPSKDWRAIGT